MPQDISDLEDFYKDSSNKHQNSSGNKSFCELLSPSDYQGSAATTPSGRDNKSGWYDIHQKHVNLSLNSKTILVLIGDSIVAGLSRYANIWRTFFKTFHTLNYGIGGDRTQHVLWRAENATLPNSLKYVVIHCGTNNIDRYQPRDIANGVISIGLKLQEKCRGLKVIVTGLLPRDSEWSQRRKKINLINYYMEKLCCDRFDDFHFMKQDDDWTDEDGKLDKKLYYADQLHLVEAGNRKFAYSILKILSKLMQDEKLGNSSDERKAHYLFESSSDVNHCKPVSDSKPIRPVSYSKSVHPFVLVNLFVLLIIVNLCVLFIVNLYVLLVIVNLCVLLFIVNLLVLLITVNLYVLLVIVNPYVLLIIVNPYILSAIVNPHVLLVIVNLFILLIILNPLVLFIVNLYVLLVIVILHVLLFIVNQCKFVQ